MWQAAFGDFLQLLIHWENNLWQQWVAITNFKVPSSTHTVNKPTLSDASQPTVHDCSSEVIDGVLALS